MVNKAGRWQASAGHRKRLAVLRLARHSSASGSEGGTQLAIHAAGAGLTKGCTKVSQKLTAVLVSIETDRLVIVVYPDCKVWASGRCRSCL